MSLSPKEAGQLLALAREAITQVANGHAPPVPNLAELPPPLREDGASFITLMKNGQLRGCIGSLEARQSLALDVVSNAVNAAFHDPRFPPIQSEELEDLQIELSVLSPPQPLPFDGPDDLIIKLRPSIDGVVIEKDWHRATFLPQVWEKLPNPHQFLEHLCIKAGLRPDAYRQPGLDVYTYQVSKFKE